MDADEVIQRVLDTFGDLSSAQINQETIDRWINDAQRDIAVQASLLETRASAVITAGNTVPYPDDLLSLISVWYKNDDGDSWTILEHKSFPEIEQMGASDGATGYCQYYSTFARSIIPYPLSDVDSTFSLFYTREPTEVNGGNRELDLPIAFHNRIYEYCMARAYALDENAEMIALQSQELSTKLSTQQNQESSSKQATYPVITVRDEDM